LKKLNTSTPWKCSHSFLNILNLRRKSVFPCSFFLCNSTKDVFSFLYVDFILCFVFCKIILAGDH
jgi:hypothetical protein